MPKFTDFFTQATGQSANPYPYQRTIAEGPWPDIINIPTGLGKTAGIIIPWLWKRQHNHQDTPRRLVYCLPMRVLVEQTWDCTIKWIDNLAASGLIPVDRKPLVHVLMGGNIQDDWRIYPERDAIIIGTQDQLLSRALNRGYAMSRFMWPVHFALLNNDSLWVMDEVQLMGSGLATSAQLEAFRRDLDTFLPAKSIWMSATHSVGWLNTVDFGKYTNTCKELTLSEKDRLHSGIEQRFIAPKPVHRLDVIPGDMKALAEKVVALHRHETLTLVILNRVNKAVELYKKLSKITDTDLSLIHARFRPEDRRKAVSRLLNRKGRKGMICVATQVVEAGVDISATTLITDLAPWSSMVQRFGRCNRYGTDKNAGAYWIDGEWKKKGHALPYLEEDLLESRTRLESLNDVSPAKLPSNLPDRGHKFVIRRSDIVSLFDTTPDLAGTDVDISRYIRESEDHDVQVFWRDVPEKKRPSDTEPGPGKDELCPVPIGEIKKLKSVDLWQWDSLEKRWNRVWPASIFPGIILMMRQSDGCYSAETGWTGRKGDVPELLPEETQMEAGYDDDRETVAKWETLREHTDAVVHELTVLLQDLGIDPGQCRELLLASRWHDAGKAHDVFRKAAVGDPPEVDETVIWGKTAREHINYERRGFRHELASALAMLECRLPDLAVYLAAAHHGKVRLSIRSMPHERAPDDPGKRFARGIWDGDVITQADLGGGVIMPQTVVDLSYMELGTGQKGPSWTARMLALRDAPGMGVFRLAFLEALLRVADWRASMKSRQKNET